MPKQVLAAYQQIVQKDLDETLRDNQWLKEEIRQVLLQNEMLRHRLKLINEEHIRNRAMEEEKLRREVEDQNRYDEWLSHEETRRAAEQAERWKREAEEQRRRAELLEREARSSLHNYSPPPQNNYQPQPIVPTWQRPTDLEVNILQARDLIPADKSTMAADPFVTVSFDDGAVVHKTPAVPGTLQPTWNSKAYVTVPSQARSLTIHVYDEDATKEPDFIGWASLPISQQTIPGEHVLDLMPRPNVAKDQRLLRNRSNLGQIRIQVKPSAAGSGSSYQNYQPAPAQQLIPDTLYVDVIKGTNMRDMDMIGKSDPYIELGFDNKPKIVRTKTKADTLNPDWNESFELTIPSGARYLTITASDEDIMSSEVMGGANIDIYTQIQRYHNPDWVDLFYEKDGKYKPAGRVMLKIRAGNRATGPISNQSKGSAPVVNPTPTMQRKSYLDLSILEAEGLAKRDTFGKSDPYVELYWGSSFANVVKKTKTISNSLTPKWNQQWNDLELPNDTLSHVTLLVLDEDSFSSKGEFLGSCQIDLNPLENGARWLPLVPRKNNPDDHQLMSKNKGTLGRIHVALNFKPGMGWTPEMSSASMASMAGLANAGSMGKIGSITSMGSMTAAAANYGSMTGMASGVVPTKLKLTIVSAENLVPADTMGKSDPYVTFQLGDAQPQPNHKTKHVDNNLNPTWNQSFQVDVPATVGFIVFTAMDHDAFDKDDFLGRAILELRERQNTELFLNLLPRPSEEEDFKMQRKYGGLGRLKVRTEWQ